MNVTIFGTTVPRELTRAIKAAGHRFVAGSNEKIEATILSGNASRDVTKVCGAQRDGVPVFYVPTGRSTVGIDTLLTSASDSTTPFYLGYQRRLSPVYDALNGQVDAGKVGKVGFIKVHSNLAIPRGYAPGKAKSCSTIVSNEMAHDFDWLNQHFGPTRKVFCQGTQTSKPSTEYAMASVTLKNGVIAQVVHSYQKKVQPSLRVEICGTEGIIQYDSTQESIRQTPRPGTSVDKLDGSANEWAQHWSAFEAMIQKGRSTKKDNRGYVAPLRISELAIQSILSGEPKKL